MTAVPLGSTNVRVSPLGVGAWAWGDRWLWGYGRSYHRADVEAAFHASLKAGLDFFDTAEIYGFGLSERLLGEFVRDAGRPAVVATKFAPYPWRVRRGDLQRALRKSLARLGLERVDLYQVHWPYPPRHVETWAAALADAVESGLARAVGVSNYSVDRMRRAHDVLARRGIPLASNQVDYSLLQRDPEHTGLLEACRELGVTLIAYSPLAQGVLTGKYDPRHTPPGLHRRRFNARHLTRVQSLVALLKETADRHGKTLGQVALNWALCKGALPIPGAKNARQAEENAGALGWRLTPDEVAALDAAS